MLTIGFSRFALMEPLLKWTTYCFFAQLFLALAIPLSAGAATESVWADYPGLKAPGHAGIEIGDFDGNGKSEAVVTTYSGQGFDFNGSQLVATLASTSDEGMKVRAVAILPSELIGPMVKAPRDGLADRLLAVTTNNGSDNKIVTLGGDPLRILRTIAAPLIRRVIAVADVDADGQLDIVAMTSASSWGNFDPVVLDYETGAVKWVGLGEISDIGVAQLDDDPALEMIMAGTPASVVDGASHATEWSYPSGFYSMKILVGQFHVDPAIRGFAVAGSSYVQIFRTHPYSPTSEFQIPWSAVAKVVKLGGAEIDEIAIGSGDGVSIHDPVTGQQLFASPNPTFDDVSDLAVGDIDDDGANELVFAGGLRSSGPDLLRAVDIGSGQIDYHQFDEIGPYSGLVVDDISGDGELETAYITVKSGSHYAGPNIRILDHATGRRLRELTNFGGSSFYSGFQLLSAQIDADPQKELIFSGIDFNSGVVSVIDGATLELEWRVGGNGSLFDGVPVSAPVAIDVNGDGIPEVIVSTVVASLVRIVVLDGRNGAILWTSVGLSGGIPRLATFQTNTGEARIAVSTGYGLYVFGLSSHLLVSSAKSVRPILALTRWEGPDGCRLGALDDANMFTIRSCADLIFDRQIPMPVGTTFVRPIDAQNHQFIAADGAQLFEVDSSGDAIAIGGGWGNGLAASNSGVVTLDPDGQHVDVVLGSDIQVMRSRIGLNRIFANGFD